MEGIYYDKEKDMFTLACPDGPSIKYEPVRGLPDDTICSVWYVGCMLVGSFEWKRGEYRAKRFDFLKKCPDAYNAREIRRQVSRTRYDYMVSHMGEAGQWMTDGTLRE